MAHGSPTDASVRPAHEDDGVFDHTVLGGYMLEHRIGTGGYGEVWKALGPGGFAKAVKVLFGNLDGPHADAELRSLQRMRDLRHPFLLNIERVDIQDGRVFVVTELADSSLENRFAECRKAGQAGVPRKELLGYLRDAADALDFMAEHHGLQHLDVKPENLLLQGSHVKVGDFGLTRDISQSSATAMGGFTPLYTPPEVFEGKPDRHSDQYSLAIVYQLMLTGTPPFSGRTPAQLAAQHLRSRPDLTLLEPAERPVVARALSKSPSSRFRSCREFVEELLARKVTGRAAAVVRSPRSQPSGEINKTRVATTEGVGASGTPVSKPSVPASVSTQPPEAETHRPTVFIGLGGLGGSVVCTVRDRLRNHQAAANLSFLYVDSDRTSIAASLRQAGVELLGPDETVLVPLKTATEYRNSTHLEWLSRRWLFNIPRSGQVEGIRPLGRLAFLDHYRSLRERVVRLLSPGHGSGGENTTESSDTSERQQAAPDIVIVSAISGGFGSGAVLDLAYLVRDVLETEQLDGGRITACLLHGSGTSPQNQQLQEANAYACLTEMKYYGTQGLGYDCSISRPHPIHDHRAFDHCYVIHLGESLSTTDFSAASANVADYLCASVTGPEARWLQQWRQSEASQSDKDHHDDSEQTCRSVGFARIDDETMHFAAQMCHAVAAEWTCEETGGREQLTAAAVKRVDEALRRMTPSAELLREHISSIVGNASEELRNQLLAALNASSESNNTTLSSLSAWFHTQSGPAATLAKTYDDLASNLVRQVSARAESTVELLKHTCVTRSGIEAVGGQILQRLEVFSQACTAFQRDAQHQWNDLVSDGNKVPAAQGLEKLLLHWGIAGLTRTLDGYAQQLSSQTALRILQASRNRSRDMLEMRRQFATMAGIEDSDLMDEDLEEHEELNAGERSEDRCQIPATLAKLLSDQLLASSDRTVPECLKAGGADLAASMMIQRAVELATSLLKTELGEDGPRFPANARPYLSEVGGRHRVLAVTPGSLPEKWKESLSETFGDCIAECSQASRLRVWCEVEGIPLDAVQQFLARRNPQVKEVASRVQTRRDIEWSNAWL